MIRNILMIAAVLGLAASPALARPKKGGGAASARAGGKANRPGNGNRPSGGHYNGGSGHNTNVVINSNGGHHGGYNGGRYHDDHDVWDAVGTAAAVTATVGITRAIIGTTVTQQPAGCVPVNVGPTAFLQCGSNWYQPTYVGTQIQYVVVAAPR